MRPVHAPCPPSPPRWAPARCGCPPRCAASSRRSNAGSCGSGASRGSAPAPHSGSTGRRDERGVSDRARVHPQPARFQLPVDFQERHRSRPRSMPTNRRSAVPSGSASSHASSARVNPCCTKYIRLHPLHPHRRTTLAQLRMGRRNHRTQPRPRQDPLHRRQQHVPLPLPAMRFESAVPIRSHRQRLLLLRAFPPPSSSDPF